MATTEATNTQQTASTEKGKEPRFFDAAIYAKKLKDALTELAKKTPGELSGSVGKSEILKSGAAQMQELVDAGFTLKQISDAISNDVFKILPKSLTEVLHGKKESVVEKTKAVKTGTEKSSKSTTEAVKKTGNSDTSKAAKDAQKPAKAAANNASFPINDDTPDGDL